MMIVLQDSIAVHSTANGDCLWNAKPEPEDARYLIMHKRRARPLILMTRRMAVFIICNADQGGGYSHGLAYNLRIYGTENGTLLKSTEIPRAFLKDISRKIVAKDSILCYNFKLTFHVFRVGDGKVKEYVFSFPSDHLAQLEEFTGSKCTGAALQTISLLGFLAKTNVLMGSLKVDMPEFGCAQVIFSLNLDAAINAKNADEIDTAFSWLLSAFNPVVGTNEYDFKPVYRTDRAKNSVELVGIMMKSLPDSSSDVLTIENSFFVTEMELPNE